MTRFSNCEILVSAEELSRKSKLVAKKPFKAFERVTVDGIRPQPASMLGTVGLELINFINPELSWKTVARGLRTTSRRSRRGVRSLTNGVQSDVRYPQREESSVSESEKHGVAVLGRRFAEKVEHVPIKKRRLLLHSSSPPPRNPSPSQKEPLLSQQNKPRHGKCVSVQWCSPDLNCSQETVTSDGSKVADFPSKNVDNNLIDGTTSKFTTGKVRHVDFSGIALLAATACSNMINDIVHVKDGSMVDQSSTPKQTDSFVSITPLKESVTSVDAISKLIEDPTHEQGGSSAQDVLTAVSQNFYIGNDSEAVQQSASVKRDRSHWDLNTVMEAWETPCNDLTLKLQNNGLESYPDGGRHSERLEKWEGSEMYPADSKSCTQDESFKDSHCPGLDHFPKSCASDEKVDIPSPNDVMQTGEDLALQVDGFMSTGNLHVSCPDPHITKKVNSEVQSVDCEENCRKTSCLPDMLSTLACQTSNVEYSMNESGIVNFSHESLEQENMSALNSIGGVGLPVLAANVLSQDKEAATADAPLIDYSQSNNSPDKATLSFVVSKRDHDCMVVNEKMTEIQAGYDSPFEDGELRESVLYPQEENEVEGGIDYMDYGDDQEANHDAANYCMSELGSLGCQNVRRGSSSENVVQDGRGDDMKELMHSASSNTKLSGRDQLPEGCETSTDRSITNAVSLRCNFIYNSVDETLDVKGSCTAEGGSRASGGKRLFSHMEGPSRSDVVRWTDAVYAKQTGSNNLDETSLREEREAGSDKSLGRGSSCLLDRDQGEDDCIGSPVGYWGSRNHYLTSYRHPQCAEYPRPGGAKSRGLNYHGQRQPLNYSSKGSYRPSIRRSPGNREGLYVEHRRMVSVRDDSRSRSRGSRSGVIGQRFSRSNGEDYCGPASDDPASDDPAFDNPASMCGRMAHHLSYRDRGLSPVSNRGAEFYRPHRKSRSQSRTRSPPAWNLQRERNMGLRRLSRSPDLRFEARMERTRFPYQKSSFTVNEEDNFMSSGRFSPQYHSKWIDNRTDSSDHIGGRRSPGRMFRRSHRFDWMDSAGRMKSDEHFGRLIRPGRFTDLAGGIGSGRKYDSGDDGRRNHADRYEIIHRVRRYDTSGVVKRFQYDTEDFEAHNVPDENGHIRSADRREIFRNAGEERSPFRYNGGRMYKTGPKLSGIQDYDEDASPRKR